MAQFLQAPTQPWADAFWATTHAARSKQTAGTLALAVEAPIDVATDLFSRHPAVLAPGREFSARLRSLPACAAADAAAFHRGSSIKRSDVHANITVLLKRARHDKDASALHAIAVRAADALAAAPDRPFVTLDVRGACSEELVAALTSAKHMAGVLPPAAVTSICLTQVAEANSSPDAAPPPLARAASVSDACLDLLQRQGAGVRSMCVYKLPLGSSGMNIARISAPVLQRLSLEACDLEGGVRLDSFTGLTQLRLCGNHMRSEAVLRTHSALRQLTGLAVLVLADPSAPKTSTLADKVDGENIGSLTGLQELQLSFAQLPYRDGTLLAPALSNLFSLTRLDVSICEGRAGRSSGPSLCAIWTALTPLTGLRNLKVQDALREYEDGGLQVIRSIGIWCRASGKHLTHLSICLQFTHLLQSNDIALGLLGSIAALPRLRSLALLQRFEQRSEDRKWDEDGRPIPPQLCRMSALESLCLFGWACCPEVTGKTAPAQPLGMPVALAQLTALTRVELHRSWLDVFCADHGLESYASLCECALLAEVLRNLPMLAAIHLSGNQIGEEQARMLAPALLRLELLQTLRLEPCHSRSASSVLLDEFTDRGAEVVL